MNLAQKKLSITQEAAEVLLDASKVAADEIGIPMAIAIVDESGTLKAFRCMDGAALLSVTLAQDKAYIAVAF